MVVNIKWGRVSQGGIKFIIGFIVCVSLFRPPVLYYCILIVNNLSVFHGWDTCLWTKLVKWNVFLFSKKKNGMYFYFFA